MQNIKNARITNCPHLYLKDGLASVNSFRRPKWTGGSMGAAIEIRALGKAKLYHAWPFAIVVCPAVEEADPF